MSIELRASADVAVPIERAWAVWVDAARFPQWQGGLLAVTDIDGPLDVVGTTFVLDHGPRMKRTGRVVAVERPVRHVVEQTGVGVHDQVVATFEPIASGTRVTVAYYGHLNAVMRVLSRLDRSARMQREAQHEVDRFAAVAERVPGPARVGARYMVEAGAEHRWVTVTGVDDGAVHVRPPWEHRLRRMSDEAIEAGTMPDLSLGIGHTPLQRAAFQDAKPIFAGVTTRTREELLGYEFWKREAGGSTFTTLQMVLGWPTETHTPN